MGKIIALVGSIGVGKSTLVNNLLDMLPQLYIRDGFYIENSFDLNTISGFANNERLYINKELFDYQRFKDTDSTSLVVRGVEDNIFFAKFFPKYINKKWNIETELQEEFQRLNSVRSDLVLYLYADKEVLFDRIRKDTKHRVNYEYWVTNWMVAADQYYRSLENVFVLDTSHIAADEVARKVVDIIQSA